MDLLNEERVLPALQGETRDEVIEEMIEHLCKRGALTPSARANVLSSVLRREASQTTGLGAGVAIPHGQSSGVEEIMAILGIHRGGVDFSAVDGQPVHLVILLVVPPNRFQAHLRTLAGIARVLNDPLLREEILLARRPEALMATLRQKEAVL